MKKLLRRSFSTRSRNSTTKLKPIKQTTTSSSNNNAHSDDNEYLENHQNLTNQHPTGAKDEEESTSQNEETLGRHSDQKHVNKDNHYLPAGHEQQQYPETFHYNPVSNHNNQHDPNRRSSKESNSIKLTKAKSKKLLKTTTHYEWDNDKSENEEVEDEEATEEDIERIFHQCFSERQWQNAVLYTVVKTSLANPELKTSIKREGDRSYQGRLHRRLSSGISNFYQLLEVHKAENRKGGDPDLMSLSNVLR